MQKSYQYKDQGKLAQQMRSGQISKPSGASFTDDDYMRFAQYFFGLYSTDRCSILSNGILDYSRFSSGGDVLRRSISELRAYSNGLQSPDKYRQWVPEKDKAGNKTMNISYANIMIMPKFKEQALATMSDYKFRPHPVATDGKAIKSKQETAALMKLYTNPAVKQMEQALGMSPPGKPDMTYVDTENDVDTLMELGGLPFAAEVEAKDAVDSVLNNSIYEDNLEAMLDADIYEIGMLALEHRLTDKGEVLEYIDPDKGVFGYSEYLDHRDMSFGGYIKDMSVATLRKVSDLNEKDLYLIAKSHRNFGQHNKGVYRGTEAHWASYHNREQYKNSAGAYPYDPIGVSVFTCYFKGEKELYYLIGKSPMGNDQRLPISKSDTSRYPEEMIATERVNTVYQLNWVIGTKYVYKSGEVPYSDGETLPITVISTGTVSKVERCISLIDDLQIAVLKRRNAISKFTTNKMVIDRSRLKQTVRFGNVDYSLSDLLKIFHNTGVLVVESINKFQPGVQYQGKPVEFMSDNMYQDLEILFREAQIKIDQIREATGLNPIFDGTSQNDRMLKPMIESMNTAANNAMRKLFIAKKVLAHTVAKKTLSRWSRIVLNGDVELTTPQLFGIPVEKKVTKRILEHIWEFKLTVTPTAYQLQLINQELIDKETKGMITPADKFFIMRLLEDGDVGKAQYYIAKAVSRRENELHRREMEKIESNNRGNLEASVAGVEAEIKKINAEYDRKDQHEAQKFDQTRQLSELKHKQRLEEIQTSTVGKAVTDSLVN